MKTLHEFEVGDAFEIVDRTDLMVRLVCSKCGHDFVVDMTWLDNAAWSLRLACYVPRCPNCGATS